MAKAAKINNNFDDYTEDDFYKAAKLIFNVLTINAGVFTGIPMDLAVFIKLITNYDDIRTAPFYKGIGADISAARTAVQTVITENGTWLNNFCKGDLTLLNKTGYPLEKESVAQGKLDQTIIILSLLKINGAIGFLISHIALKNIKYGVKYTLTTNLETDPTKWVSNPLKPFAYSVAS